MKRLRRSTPASDLERAADIALDLSRRLEDLLTDLAIERGRDRAARALCPSCGRDVVHYKSARRAAGDADT